MTEPELDPFLERIVAEARRPVFAGPHATARLRASIQAEPLPVRQHGAIGWFANRRLTVSPLASMAAAAALIGLGITLGVYTQKDRDGLTAGRPRVAVASSAQLPAPSGMIERTFVLSAPGASKVSLVGDFNQWNTTATPMARSDSSGLVTVTIPLAPGRHEYSYLVDGQWISDPTQASAPDDGFGHRSSVIVVDRESTL